MCFELIWPSKQKVFIVTPSSQLQPSEQENWEFFSGGTTEYKLFIIVLKVRFLQISHPNFTLTSPSLASDVPVSSTYIWTEISRRNQQLEELGQRFEKKINKKSWHIQNSLFVRVYVQEKYWDLLEKHKIIPCIFTVYSNQIPPSNIGSL